MITMESISHRIPQRIASPLCLCLLLTACSLIPHGAVDSGLAVFIPPDTQVLAGIRFDQLSATPLYRKLAARSPAFHEFREQSGFDPARDLHEVLLASDGKSILAIAQGAFPLKLPGALYSSPYKGYTLSGDELVAVTFLDKGRALAGPVAVVRAAIDQYQSGRRGAPRDLMARAEALPRDAQIWAVMQGWSGVSPETLREMGNAANLDRVLRAVESASLTADLRSGVHAAFTGDCRTPQDAKTLSESLQGLLGLVRASVPAKRPDMLRAFAGIRVTQDARAVKVNVDIPQDLADKLVDELAH
jgi:hypothetical protein